MSKIDELRWIRAFSPDLLPRYLVEQIKNKDFTVDEFYSFQRANCTISDNNGISLNPTNHLYFLVDPSNQVKGFLWLVVDVLTKDLVINNYSLDSNYWCKGQAVKKLSKFVKELLNKLKFNKIYWITRYPKHSKKYGFKPSKDVLMEYDPKGEEDGQVSKGIEQNKEDGHSNTGSEENSDSSIG